MALTIGVLGPLVIESDDCRLGKVPKKARALLGFLAAQGGQEDQQEQEAFWEVLRRLQRTSAAPIQR